MRLFSVNFELTAFLLEQTCNNYSVTILISDLWVSNTDCLVDKVLDTRHNFKKYNI